MNPQNDPKFQAWVRMVSPSPIVQQNILTSIDWQAVLQLLADIFTLLAETGCFASARVTSNVKKILSGGLSSLTCPQLQVVLNDLGKKQKRKGKGMKSLFMFIAMFQVLTAMAYPHLVDAKGHHHGTGLKRDHKKFKQFKHAHHLKHSVLDSTTVPGSWDLTSKVSPPLDQGQCGDCWNFSIFKSFWSENMLAGNAMMQPAANYLLNNCSGVSDAREYGCNGGDFPAGEGMLAPAHGVWAESSDPYTARDGRCVQGLPSLGLALTWVVVGDGNNPPSFQQLAQANYNAGLGHVLSVDVDAESGSWMNYSGGIYAQNGGSNIDHMIDQVGYDCESSVDNNKNCVFNAKGQPINGDGYLKVQNNWGTSWGEGGYMRTRWGMNAIAQTAMYFTVVRPAPPTPIPPTPPIPPAPVGVNPIWVYIAGGIAVIAIILLAVLK